MVLPGSEVADYGFIVPLWVEPQNQPAVADVFADELLDCFADHPHIWLLQSMRDPIALVVFAGRQCFARPISHCCFGPRILALFESLPCLTQVEFGIGPLPCRRQPIDWRGVE